MVVLGVLCWLAPHLIGAVFPLPKLVRAHLGLCGLGVLLIVLPLAVGGLLQGFKLQSDFMELVPDMHVGGVVAGFKQQNVPFMEILKGTLPFLRASTMGDLLIASGNLLFVVNLAGSAYRLYRARAAAAYEAATAELFQPAEVKT